MPSLESKHPLLITAAKVTIKLETTKQYSVNSYVID